MRHFLIRATVLSVLVIGASRVLAFPSGAVSTRTDARGFFTKPKEPNCTACHSADLSGIPSGINDPSGFIRILDVPAQYAPSAVYILRVHVEHNWTLIPPDPLRWGFQLQAIQASTGDSSGLWILTPNVAPDSFKILKGVSTSVYKNRRYVDQAGWLSDVDHPGGPTHMGEVGPVEWHVKWQAPPGDSGKIYFFAAGNSANGDGNCSQSGDFIFTTVESTIAGGNTAVFGQGRSSTLAAPNPNPMHRFTTLSFSLMKGGLVDLAIFDLGGRRVRTLVREFREAGGHPATWNGRNDRGEPVPDGIYFARLRTPEDQVVTRKIALAN